MNREYHKWHSRRLGRTMELLVFGHAGMPALVFPTSAGRFFQFEDCGMVGALGARIEAGQLQLYCVDSVDRESWYNRQAPPRARIARHIQYEQYAIEEVLPLVSEKNPETRPMAVGCSFGGYHAVNIALRHPDLFRGFLSMSGAFDLAHFLDGVCDGECYFHLPTYYLPGLTDPWYLERFRHNRFVLATGWDDHCLEQNQALDRILNERGIAHEYYVWDTWNAHDWPTWQRMAQTYL